MSAGAESLSDGKKEHSYKEMPVITAKPENNKGDYISDKRENHTAAASEKVGNSAAWYLYKVNKELTKADKYTDLSK
jgi:hypothetical protein